MLERASAPKAGTVGRDLAEHIALIGVEFRHLLELVLVRADLPETTADPCIPVHGQDHVAPAVFHLNDPLVDTAASAAAAAAATATAAAAAAASAAAAATASASASADAAASASADAADSAAASADAETVIMARQHIRKCRWQVDLRCRLVRYPAVPKPIGGNEFGQTVTRTRRNGAGKQPPPQPRNFVHCPAPLERVESDPDLAGLGLTVGPERPRELETHTLLVNLRRSFPRP